MPKYNDFDLDVQNEKFNSNESNRKSLICIISSVRPTTDDPNKTHYCETMWCTERCSTHPIQD